MPNRVIRESALYSPTLHQLSASAERLFWRLLLVADDFGRFAAASQVVANRCFPLARLTGAQVEPWLEELEAVGLVKLYQNNFNLYGYFIRWTKHHRMRTKVSRFPDPSE